MRTRTAAKRAFSRPFVPLRQLTVCHLALASMSSAAIDRISGTCRLRGRPRTWQPAKSAAHRPDTPSGDEGCQQPRQPAGRETLTERRAEAVSGIRQHTAKAHTGRDHAIDLGQARSPAWSALRDARRNAGPLQTRRIARPTLGKEETQCHHHRHFTARKRQRHQRLAIGRLAERRGILRRDTNRAIALLRHRGVVDDQHRILAADEPVGLNEQLRSSGAASQTPSAIKWCN